MPKKPSRITLDLNSEDRKKLKVISSLMGISMRSLIMKSLTRLLSKDYKDLVQTFSGTEKESV